MARVRSGSNVVLQWRLPRAVAAAVFGAALGISGAIFQSVTRNALGSPDIIGFNAGAFTGAIISIGFLGGSQATTTLLALAGGGVTAFLVYALAFRRGVSGTRFVVIGIAVSLALVAFNTLLVLRMEQQVATVAMQPMRDTARVRTWPGCRSRRHRRTRAAGRRGAPSPRRA